jgi:hypothetical protein
MNKSSSLLVAMLPAAGASCTMARPTKGQEVALTVTLRALYSLQYSKRMLIGALTASLTQVIAMTSHCLLYSPLTCLMGKALGMRL